MRELSKYFSEKLKAIILLAISQNIDTDKFHDNNQKLFFDSQLLFVILYPYNE